MVGTTDTVEAVFCDDIKGLLRKVKVTRNDIRAVFIEFLRGDRNIGAELRGRLKGHLLRCESCALAVAEIYYEEVEAGRIVIGGSPLQAEPILRAVDALKPDGGIRWTPLRELVVDSSTWGWPKEMLAVAGRRLTATLDRFMQPRLGLGLALGPGMGPENEDPNAAAGWSDSEHINLVDDMGSPKARTVLFEISTPPTVTEDGVLRLQARTREAALEGTTLLCTVAVTEGARITFEGRLQAAAQGAGFEVEIKEEGIPFPQSSESPAAEPRTVVIPKGHVTLTLQKNN